MFRTLFCTRRGRVEVILVALMLVLVMVMAGCGGNDDQEQTQTEKRHSMVPVNLDTLIAETGSDLLGNQSEAGTNQAPQNTPQGQVPESNVENSSTIPQVREVETPAADQPNPATQTGKSGTYSLQVGSFGLLSNANSLAAKVNNQGYTASVEQALVNGKTYHRVFVRGLASQSAAENLGEELHASLGISYLVRRQP